MKKELINITLIVGIIAFIGACKSDDDSSTTTATCAGMPVATVSTCSDTVSGSITGLDNSTMSGVYDPFHALAVAGTAGIDNTTGCVSSTSMLANMGGPTGTAGVTAQYAVTSSSSIAWKQKYYSDSSCSTETASISFSFNDVTVGDNVTGLSTSISGKSSTYPSTATKVTWNNSCNIFKASTAAGVTYLDTLFSGTLSLDLGTEYKCANQTGNKYLLMKVWDTSALGIGYDSILYWEDSDTAHPTDWSSDVNTWTKMP